MNSGILIRSATILTLGGLVEALAGFGSQLVLARALGPEAFGRFATSLAVIGIIFSFGTMRIAQLIIRSTPEALRDDQTMLLSALVWETVACSLLGTLWVVLDRQASTWDIVLVAAAALQHWLSGNRAVVERSLVFHRIGIAETVASLTGHAVALSMALLGGGAAALYVREGVNALAKLIGMIWARALTSTPINWVRPFEWRRVFTQSRGIWLDGLLEGAFQRLSIVAASSLAGFHGAGLFFFAQRLAGVPQQLMGPIVNRLSGPWFSSLSGGNRLRLLRRMLTIAAAPLTIAAIGIYFTADWIIPTVFGDQWRESAPVLQAMAGAIVFNTLIELLKTLLIVNHNARGVLFGRVAQFSGFALVIVAYRVSDGAITPVVMGLALSCASIMAFLIMLKKVIW